MTTGDEVDDAADAEDVAHAVVQRAWEVADTPDLVRRHAGILLADFCCCVSAGARAMPAGQWRSDGAYGQIALLAMRAHANDRDDLDWTTMTHPGSVIWPVVLGLGLVGEEAIAAAAAGYETMAQFAAILAGAAPKWHLTALAGHPGAAAAAGRARGMTRGQAASAVQLALSVMGGLGATSSARTNAGAWHRSSAAVVGAQAAEAASAGLMAPPDVFGAPNGVADVFTGAPARRYLDQSSEPAIARTSLRLYATNGFAQGPVHASADLGRTCAGHATTIRVQVASIVAAATAPTTPGGDWWHLPAAVAAAFVTGDPWLLEDPSVYQRPDVADMSERIVVEAQSSSPLQCSVVVGSERVDLDEPPGFRALHSVSQLASKCAALHVSGEPLDLARRLLDGDRSALSHLLAAGS